MRWKKALGRSVISTESAKEIGQVDGLVVDPSTQKITAIVVGDKIVSWSDCGGIGSDAVTVTESAMLSEASTDLETRALDGESDPLGKSVLTEHGLAMGSLVDIDFDPESGDLKRLVLADDEVSGSRLIGIGSYAVVISSGQDSSGAPDLESLSKAELYEQAQDRDLDGRSSMTKKELIAALS